MHVVDGEIMAVNVSETEDDPAGGNDPSASCADGIMATMKELWEGGGAFVNPNTRHLVIAVCENVNDANH
jgi:hypothetical protein